jgi:hypothetical protein
MAFERMNIPGGISLTLPESQAHPHLKAELVAFTFHP